MIALLPHHLGEATYLGERGKIRRQKDRRTAAAGLDLFQELPTPVRVTTVDQNVSALLSQALSHPPADAIG
jgi:anaerobic glycerol-3-phosphate dehydrogenase